MWTETTNRIERNALWTSYGADRAPDRRERLIHAYDGYARMMAARYFGQRMRDGISFDEYLQFARIGLIEAIDSFEPDRGVLFETFAGKRIKGAIVDGIASMSEVQRQLAERRQRVRERSASLADEAEAPAEEGLEQLFARLADIAVGFAIGFTLESEAAADPGLPGYGDTTYASVELRQLRELILAAVRELPGQVRDVITRHYLQQQSFAEVAGELGVTRGRVSQLHRDGIERLRLRMKRRAGLDLQC